jgi:hypothetical protein
MNDPNIGHKGLEPISSVSLRIRLSKLSYVLSRHHHYREIIIDQVEAQVQDS